MKPRTQGETAGFHCPVCVVGLSEVKDSRRSGANSIRRRRHCKTCGHRFTTYEGLTALPEQREARAQLLLDRILPRLRSVADLIDELDVETRAS